MAEMNEILKGSVVDRFAVTKAMGIPPPPSAGVSWQDRDEAIGKAIRKGDSTFAGWMDGVGQMIEAAKLFIANNNVPAAMAIDEEIRKVTNANPDAVLRYSNLTGVQPGSLAERMRGIAVQLRDGSYRKDEVTFGGQKYTYGSLLRSDEGRAAVEQSTSDTLTGLGFDRPVASMMLSGTASRFDAEDTAAKSDAFLKNSDDTAKSCMKFLTDNDLRIAAVNRGVIPNDPSRAVRSGMANELAANWKTYFKTFGSATESFVTKAYASFRDSGGDRMMPGIRDYAVRLSQKTGLTGKSLVDEAFHQYDDWKAAVTKTNRQLAPGQTPDPDDVGLNEQNAALAGAISALSRMDVDFDLRNPASRANASELGDLIAKLKVSGVNFVGEARKNGVDVNSDMGMHILRVASPGSSVASVKAFFEDQKRYTGGMDFASSLYGATHSAADYWMSLSRQNGGQSSCPGADALLTGVRRARAQSIVPVMISRGMSHRDAMTAIRFDQSLASKYASGMADAFALALPGAGSREAAAALTRYMFDHESDAAGGEVNIQRVIQDAAEGKIKEMLLSRDAVDSLRGWVSANVTDASAFGSLPDQMRQKLVGLKVDPYYAAMLTSQACATASFLKSQGKDWTRPFSSFLSDLTLVPEQQFDSNGRLLSTHMVFGHANTMNKEIVVRGQKMKIRPGMYENNPLVMESIFGQAGAEGAELRPIQLRANQKLADEDPAAYAGQ